jgi:hypothetical protein
MEKTISQKEFPAKDFSFFPYIEHVCQRATRYNCSTYTNI